MVKEDLGYYNKHHIRRFVHVRVCYVHIRNCHLVIPLLSGRIRQNPLKKAGLNCMESKGGQTSFTASRLV